MSIIFTDKKEKVDNDARWGNTYVQESSAHAKRVEARLQYRRVQESVQARGQYQGAGARAVEIAEVAGARAGENAVSKSRLEGSIEGYRSAGRQDCSIEG